MTGPLVRLDIRSKSFAVNAPALIVLAAICLILVGHETPDRTSSTVIVASAALSMFVYLAAMFALDIVPAFYVPGSRVIGPLTLSASGVSGIWRSDDEDSERRSMIAGLSVTSVLAVSMLVVAYHLQDGANLVASGGFVMALMIGAVSCVRLCPILPFPGGIAARRTFSLLVSDEDSVVSTSAFASYWGSGILALSGFVIMANPGTWGPWGLAALCVGVDCALLTRMHSQRTQWVEKASSRSLETIRYSRLPTVSQTAPVSELFSIFAVEGNRATIVVIDELGQPSGLIQLRHLKGAARAGRSVRPAELMLTLSDVPEFACESSILDAAMSLERRGASALVTQCGEGKRRVISLEELMRLGEVAD